MRRLVSARPSRLLSAQAFLRRGRERSAAPRRARRRRESAGRRPCLRAGWCRKARARGARGETGKTTSTNRPPPGGARRRTRLLTAGAVIHTCSSARQAARAFAAAGRASRVRLHRHVRVGRVQGRVWRGGGGGGRAQSEARDL